MKGFKNSTKTHYMSGGSCYAKGGSVADKKIGRVMTEFTEGKLHSGSKEGPKVKSTKQAVAIALNEARAAGAKIPRVMKKQDGGAVARGNRIAREEASEEKITRMAAPTDDFRKRHGIEVEKTVIKRIPADAVDRERAARAAKPTRGPAGQSYTGVPLIDNAVNAVRRATGLKKGGLAVMPKGKGKC